MASRGKRPAGNPPDGSDGRGKRIVLRGQAVPLGEPSRKRDRATTEEEEEVSLLALHEQLRGLTDQYMAAVVKEQELFYSVIGRQEVRIAYLEQRVAELTAELARRG